MGQRGTDDLVGIGNHRRFDQSALILKLSSLDLVAGNDDSLGRPFLYGTTRKFLEVFGLQSLDDLPMAERLRLPKTSQNWLRF